MPVQDLNFLGINRAISDFSPSSACEELINLRPSTNGLVPVNPFSVQMANTGCKKVFIHETTAGTKYIGIQKSSGLLYILLLNANGSIITTITSISISAGVNPNLSEEHVSFAYAGNIMLLSICDKTDGYYKTLSYIWIDTAYKETEANVPTISPSISVGSINDVTEWIEDFPAYEIINETFNGVSDAINSAFNKIQENNKDTCFGPTIIAIAFKTKDGETFWTDKWYVYDPTFYIENNSTNYYYNTLSDLPSALQTTYSAFYTKYAGYGGFKVAYRDQSTEPTQNLVRLIGAKISMTIPSLTQGSWNKETSMLSSIEIYASRPNLYLDEGAYADGIHRGATGAASWQCLLPRLPYGDMELTDKLLYLQRSISLETLNESSQTFDLQFGGNVQMGEDTLTVDAGAVTRYGKILAYNARFHYFDSVSATSFTVPDFSYYLPSGTSAVAWDVALKYTENGKETMVYVGQKNLPPASMYENIHLAIAPSLNIQEVLIFCPNVGGTAVNTVRYSMMGSTTYNYSIWAEGFSRSVSRISDSDWATMKAGYAQGSVISEEKNEINVTEQYNPFVFEVEHSYVAPGVVKDIQPQMAYDIDNTYGGYPLNVFTDRGVYALNQGSSNVLYGSFDPLTNLVTQSNSVSTDMGTFYLAAGSLWLVAGRHTTLISDALSLGPHKYIRDCTMYANLCKSDTFYNITDYESAVPFSTFANGAVLSYNRFRNELYISNPTYEYSYALSLKHRQWFKLTYKLHQDSIGSHIAMTDGSVANYYNIIDFGSEVPWQEGQVVTKVMIHLQSRPFSFGYQYSHIHRIVSMIRSNIPITSTSAGIVVALYGSDDLQTWNLLSYANRRQVKVSQIRIPPAARSWRYYTICIGGYAPLDTDLGPSLVDFENVIRRIG